jgi:bacterioferritin-associated ferredoxin
VPFTLVRDLHASGLSLPQIVERTNCGTGCGLCEPYVRVVCATGRTRIPLMSPTQLEAVLARAEAASATAQQSHPTLAPNHPAP